MSEGLRPDRANRIADAVEDIEQNVARLREYQCISHEEYVTPDEQDRRDALERKFEKLTEAVLDVATEICKVERGTAPNDAKTSFPHCLTLGSSTATRRNGSELQSAFGMYSLTRTARP
jgi:uncharacterized protein YutE (UPF0331/DUF86 family)